MKISSSKGGFSAGWRPPVDAAPPRFDLDGRLLDRAYANSVRSRTEGTKGTITVADTKKGERKPPPLLFSLSELQKVAGAAFGLSPGETLEAAQNLYNKYKLTTYPRVDCQYAPVEMWKEATQVFTAVRENFGAGWSLGDQADASRRSRAFDDIRLAFVAGEGANKAYFRGNLFDNDRKVDGRNHPDYTGDLLINSGTGDKLRLAAWIKFDDPNDESTAFLSLDVSEYRRAAGEAADSKA